MYGKLIDGKLLIAPDYLQINGVKVYNGDSAAYLEAGYKRVIISYPPNDGNVYKPTYTENEIEIIQEWALDSKATAREAKRELTAYEAIEVIARASVNTVEIDDQTSLRMKTFYPTFDEIIGQTVKQGFKFVYAEELYKTVQPELTIQAHYLPGEGTESLYTRIDETHTGDITDPIPYNGNMALESGKYYTQDGVLYLCTRDTVNPVYHALSDLVGLYVVVVDNG